EHPEPSFWGHEWHPVCRVDGKQAKHDKKDDDRQLDRDDGRICPRTFPGPPDQEQGEAQDNTYGGEVDDSPISARRAKKGRRKADPDGPEEGVEVPGPADCHRRDRKTVFENEIPADDPRPDLAERDVAVGIGAPGKRDQGGKFSIAERSKEAGNTGNNERKRKCITGVQSRDKTGQDKYSHTDDAPDAEHDEVKRA